MTDDSQHQRDVDLVSEAVADRFEAAGYTALAACSVLWSGWECDSYVVMIRLDDGRVELVWPDGTGMPGDLSTEQRLEERIRDYERATEKTRAFLERLQAERANAHQPEPGRTKRPAELACRHFRNAALISREISSHPRGSLEAYKAEMACRAAIQSGWYFAEIALRGAPMATVSAQTVADMAETEAFRDFSFHSPDVITLSRTLRAAEAAGRLANAVYEATAKARALAILDRAPDAPPEPGDEKPGC